MYWEAVFVVSNGNVSSGLRCPLTADFALLTSLLTYQPTDSRYVLNLQGKLSAVLYI